MEQKEELLRDIVVFIGDLNRMDKRLSELCNKAKELNIDINDLPESTKTLKRLRNEAYQIHSKIGNDLQD